MTHKRKCLICDARPALKSGYCANCGAKIDSERRARAEVQPAKFLTYRGHVVGLYPTGKGTLKARLETRNADTLPQSRVLDLNTYLDSFDRDQIKRFKRCVLSLAHA